jgi:hypothetical protein
MIMKLTRANLHISKMASLLSIHALQGEEAIKEFHSEMEEIRDRLNELLDIADEFRKNG